MELPDILIYIHWGGGEGGEDGNIQFYMVTPNVYFMHSENEDCK